MTDRISIDVNYELLLNIFGSFDANIKLIEDRLDVAITSRGESIIVTGLVENLANANDVLSLLIEKASKNEEINSQVVTYFLDTIGEQQDNDGIEELVADSSNDIIAFTVSKKPVQPKTVGQKRYIKAIKENTVVLGVGPAGTGKTYLAMAMAIRAFKNNEVNRIILTRPAIEAGENLGFLPGDLQQKVDPYLRPLYDALYEIMGAESFIKNMEKGLIEVAPLAYMRGRTLDNAFIVLDEAQNTTEEQMKMFLTRIGFGSKVVVTGDLTQVDLPRGKRSGLEQACSVLSDVSDIEICKFSTHDVVRHKLVQSIIKAYEKEDKKRKDNAFDKEDKKQKNKNSYIRGRRRG